MTKNKIFFRKITTFILSVAALFLMTGNMTANAAEPYAELAGKLILNGSGVLEGNLPANVTADYDSSAKVLTLVLDGANIPRSDCHGYGLP